MNVYRMEQTLCYRVDVIAESEEDAKRAADAYFDDIGIMDDDDADSDCVDRFDLEDAGDEIIVATEYGYEHYEGEEE